MCQMCDHMLIRPKRFTDFAAMIKAATNDTSAGKALRKHIEVDEELMLYIINDGMNADWIETLERIAERLGGGND